MGQKERRTCWGARCGFFISASCQRACDLRDPIRRGLRGMNYVLLLMSP